MPCKVARLQDCKKMAFFRFAMFTKIIYTYPNADSVPKGSSLNSEFSVFKVVV